MLCSKQTRILHLHVLQLLFLKSLSIPTCLSFPLDHEQRWYRYHPLFAELLRSYLQKNNPASNTGLAQPGKHLV